MVDQTAALLLVCSAGVLAVIWFVEVRGLLCRHRSMIESAEMQLLIYQRSAAMAGLDQDMDAVLARSESIYRQAVDNYNQLLACPWIGIPAVLMHFSAV